MRLRLLAPRELLRTLPYVATLVIAKAVLESSGVHPLDLNPLLSGLIAAMVFMLGFLLSGTLADYKESEHLPGELACSLETMADECLILRADHPREGRAALAQVVEVGTRSYDWLHNRRPLGDALCALRDLNPHLAVMAPLIQPGFTTRLKSEQAALRKTLVRMDTISSTEFIPAGYVIVQIIGALLALGLLLTEVSSNVGESMFFVGVIALLMSYLYLLIRDLDNPFGYVPGAVKAADVSLAPLEASLERLRGELAAT